MRSLCVYLRSSGSKWKSKKINKYAIGSRNNVLVNNKNKTDKQDLNYTLGPKCGVQQTRTKCIPFKMSQKARETTSNSTQQAHQQQ